MSTTTSGATRQLPRTTPWRPQYWPFRVTDRVGFWLRWIARIWLAVATIVFAAGLLEGGMPRGIDQENWEVSVQLFLLGVVVFGELLAWRWQALGASIIAVGAVGLGAFAAIEYTPERAFVIGQVFFLPAFLYWLDWQRKQAVKMIIALALALATVLGAGLYTTYRMYSYYMGPTHPASALAPLPVTVIEWAWSGNLSADGASVTARVAHDSDAVYLLVAESPDMGDPLRIGPESAREADNLRVVNFDATGLQPDTPYYYAIEVDGETDPARQGRFHTPGVGPYSFSFAAASCAISISNGQVFDSIREQEPLFYMITGDVVYSDISEPDPERYHDAYTWFLTKPAREALHLSTSVVYMWDDHDYGTNNSDRTAPTREVAQAVYRDWVPSHPLAVEGETGPIYRAFTIGRVRFILTDGRSERSPADDPDNAEKTVLGAEQKAWFKQELLNANGKYPLIVWVQSVPWVADRSRGADNWGQYQTEREELANFIADNDIEGLLMVSGDAHMLAIDDGTNTDYATGGGGGFVLLQAAPMDRPGSVKGGPYSEGTRTDSGQFGLVTVEDDGQTIEVTLSGRNYKGEEVLSYRFSVPEDGS